MAPIFVQVESPTDARNPFSAELRKGRPPGTVLAYHGTGKAALASILSEGFIARADPSLLADVEKVYSASEEFGFGGSNRSQPGIVALAFARRQLIENDGRTRPFFSGSYAHARLYALHPGGEAAVGIVSFLDDFRQLVVDERIREVHAEQLRKQLDRLYEGAPDWGEVKATLGRLDAEHLKAAWSDLEPIRLKYARLMEIDHFPVVVGAWPSADTFPGASEPLRVDVPALKPISPGQVFGVALLPKESKPVDGGLEDYDFFLEERAEATRAVRE
ncbi:MAG: hypothetical protein ACLP8Y_03180 [Thermoplasmata archaeon]